MLLIYKFTLLVVLFGIHSLKPLSLVASQEIKSTFIVSGQIILTRICLFIIKLYTKIVNALSVKFGDLGEIIKNHLLIILKIANGIV